MIYLFFQIWLWLLVAMIFGILMGWLFGRRTSRLERAQLNKDLVQWKEYAESVEKQLESYQSEATSVGESIDESVIFEQNEIPEELEQQFESLDELEASDEMTVGEDSEVESEPDKEPYSILEDTEKSDESSESRWPSKHGGKDTSNW